MKKEPEKTADSQKVNQRKRRQNTDSRQYLRQNTWVILLAVLLLIALILLLFVIFGDRRTAVQPQQAEPVQTQTQTSRYEKAYVACLDTTVPYYSADMEPVGAVARGSEITYSAKSAIEDNGATYYLAYFDSLKYGYIDAACLTDAPEKVAPEKAVYVRTPQNLRLSADGLSLGELVEQGTELQVVSYDYLSSGVAHLYEVKYGGQTGYISGEYTATTLEAATDVYDRFGIAMTHSARGDTYGGGDAGSLDYFPREKLSFTDNVMPDKVYSLYLTCDPEVIANVEDYIAYAKTTQINAFVVNIMDGTSIAYPSKVYEKYSPSAYLSANNTTEEFRVAIQKIKDAGFYVIGRLTTFNDSYYVEDHPEYAISKHSGDPLYISGSYWPSAFCRAVWEYKVELALDAVQLMGFNEIQFDYVRFPDGTYEYDEAGNIDYRNAHDETKAQAIQRFLMYACDALHDAGVYVSADVFGETCRSYVTAYGQYWPAISNVVDVISGMPYPDHFAADGSYRPWEHPYDTLLDWAQAAAERQNETPSPAIVRTWIQAYDAIRPPYNTYGAAEVSAQIKALLDAGLDGGFMAWNATCSLTKMEQLKEAYDALS